MTRSVALVVAVLVTACRAEIHRPTEQEDLLRQLGPGVHAQIVPGGVRVLNATGAQIRFVVVNPHWLGLLAPCTAAATHCWQLSPNGEDVVPPSRIYGIEDDPTVLVVRYWHPDDIEPREVSVSRGSGP